MGHFSWPNGQTGAVSLSFDDGMTSHLDAAVPELEKHGVRGTFYITRPRGEHWERTKPRWQAAHAAGHELGNHTMAHPCCLNTVGPEGLISWTLERMEADILECQRILDADLAPARPRSFAYPCYETDIGHGPTRTSYVPVVARHFTAARARGLSKQRANHPLYCDLHCLSCNPMEDADSQRLIGAADMAIEQAGWVIFTFHGVDEGHLPIAHVHLARLLDFLERERARIWTAPVIEVGEYLARHR